MSDSLVAEIDAAIRESKSIAGRHKWANNVLTALSAIATAVATICAASGAAQGGRWKYFVAAITAFPGLVIALQRTWRLEAGTAWHTERFRRMEALRRAQMHENMDDIEVSRKLTNLELELEARWQAARSRDKDGEQPTYVPMPSPSDAAQQATVAVQQRATGERVLRNELSSDDVVERLAGGQNKEAVKATLAELADRVVDKAREATSISIELPNGKTKEVPLIAVPTFDRLTDFVYFEAGDSFPAFTYGSRWRLVDSRGKALRHAREITKAGPGRKVPDTRTLEEVGIAPGDKLKVRLLSDKESA